MHLTYDETKKLWKRHYDYAKEHFPSLIPLYNRAYEAFYIGEKYAEKKEWKKALPKFYQASIYLETLWLLLNNNNPIDELKWQRWHLRLKHEKEHRKRRVWIKTQAKELTKVLDELKNNTEYASQPEAATYNLFEKNPYLSKEMKELFRPHLLHPSHPLKGALDSIFLLSRATKNHDAFEQAGFTPLEVRRSHSGIVVAKHPLLPKHLVKVYFDNDLIEKFDRPGWKWLSQRCLAAKKIHAIISKKNLKHFTVPQKWLYPLPIYPAPESEKGSIRQPVILLVEEADLLSHSASKKAWREVTEEVLDELYIIVSTTMGSSYRPDNIPMTKSGKFCFIDTEYVHSRPHYDSIRPYLSKKMKRYWDRLVKKGGRTYTQTI